MRKLSHLFPLLIIPGLAVLSATPTMAAAPEPSFCHPVRLEIEPLIAIKGQIVTIRALMEKTGDEAITCRATLLIDDKSFATQEVFYAATRYDDCGSVACSAGVQEFLFNVVRDTPGVYSVEVNGLKGSFTVEEELSTDSIQQTLDASVAELSLGAKPDPEVEDVPAPVPDNRFLIGILFAAVPIFSVIFFFLIKRMIKGYRQS